ncbi:MAG: hypothetical protein IKE24_07835 [Clostridia bacterium]|nr:hypothetical protein [Clostridia bacterium]
MNALSTNLPLILFFLGGFGLLLAEAFMPGFGIAGILGIVLELLAVNCVWQAFGLEAAVWFTLLVMALIGLTVYFSYRSAMKGRLSKSDLVLRDTQHPEEEQRLDALRALTGREAVTATPLRPGGQILLEGRRYNAASGGEFLEKGVRVQVTGAAGDHLTVCRIDPET